MSNFLRSKINHVTYDVSAGEARASLPSAEIVHGNTWTAIFENLRLTSRSESVVPGVL